MPKCSPQTQNRLAAVYFVGTAILAAGVMMPTGDANGPTATPAATPTAQGATPEAVSPAPSPQARVRPRGVA
ncbi:MAG: hypothetical protein AAF328_04090 [Planctomycetota bacterium]